MRVSVEGYPAFEADPRGLERLAASGCLLQVNAASLVGGWHSRRRRRVLRLLATGLVQLVASDGHDLHRRPPMLAAAHEVLSKRFGADRAAAWLWQNPTAILEDRPLPSEPPPAR